MKKFLIFLIFISANSADAATTLVQNQADFNNLNQTTIAITVTATGSGNLLVVATGNTSTRTVTGVSDGTNAFTQAPNAYGVDSSRAADIWYLLSSTSGKTTITITFSGAAGTFGKMGWFWEVNGLSNPVFDLAAKVDSGADSGSDLIGAAVTTTGANGFVAAVNVSSGAIGTNPKAGNAFTDGGQINANADAACSKISTVAASYQPVWVGSAGSTFASSTAAFKESLTVRHKVLQD